MFFSLFCSHLLLLARFVLDSLFFLLSFLLAGSVGNSGFVHFCLLSPYFANFCMFSAFENFSFWSYFANSLIFYVFKNFSFRLVLVLFCLQVFGQF